MHFIAAPILYTKIKLFGYLSFHEGLKIIYICLFGITFKWRNFPTQSCGNSFQFSSVAQSCPTWDPMDCSTPGLPVHHQLLSIIKLMSITSVMPSNHLTLRRPLLLPPSIFPSIRVFSNESVLHIKWPKYWTFNFSISPSNEYSRLISFRTDWLDLIAVQESLLQHHSSKLSILQHSAFFIGQFSIHDLEKP